jgi:hypothetical protein
MAQLDALNKARRTASVHCERDPGWYLPGAAVNPTGLRSSIIAVVVAIVTRGFIDAAI